MIQLNLSFYRPTLFTSLREWALSGAFDNRRGYLEAFAQVLGISVSIYWSK